MKVEMNYTLSVPEELAVVLGQLASILENEEDFTNACIAICNHEYDFMMLNGCANILYENL